MGTVNYHKEIDMNKTFAIYQIHNNDIRRNSDVTFKPTAELVAAHASDYQLVAHIDSWTGSLDNVFLISNFGQHEDLIDRKAPMHSISVGDVIKDLATGKCSVVNRYGFLDCSL
jgi:hypothetical protein